MVLRWSTHRRHPFHHFKGRALALDSWCIILRMLTSVPISSTILQYLALTALALVVATFLVTRIFYVRRIARCQAQNSALERDLIDLRNRHQVEGRKSSLPAPAGRGSQVVAIIAAVGGLSALVAAMTPIAHDFLQGQYTQCDVQLKTSKEVLMFEPNLWKAALAVPVSTNGISKKDGINLGQNAVYNSSKDSFRVKYDGTSPAIIDSDRTVSITLTLEKPSAGIRLLVRPIHPEPSPK